MEQISLCHKEKKVCVADNDEIMATFWDSEITRVLNELNVVNNE